MFRTILLLGFLLGVCQSAMAGVVRIADGDCAGLGAAVAAGSNPGAGTTILLARKGVYPACTFDAEGGNIEIDAQGATFQFLIGKIAAAASVTLRNATITAPVDGAKPTLICNSVMGSMMGTMSGFPAVCNSGNLDLVNVTIRDYLGPESIQPAPGCAYCYNSGFLYSVGSLVFRNVTVTNNQDTFLVTSEGKAEIYNSTFSNAPSLGELEISGYVLVANSIFTGGPCRLSNALVTSLGGNVGADASCGLSAAAGDKIVPGLTLPAAADHGGLVQTVQIGYGDPANRVGVGQYCEATDARGATRNSASCDAGAYESGGGLGLLTANGMNGMYYVPGVANGHYVSILRIHDNGDVMVFWNTFDGSGNPAWIFGVGTLTSDRHIHAPMYRNLGGVLQPGGQVSGAQPSPWGTVDIDLTNCLAAQFGYQSSVSGFGSGQFSLSRLAFESAIDCGD